MQIFWFISSALCYCTAELLSSRGRPSSVRCPSNPFSQNPLGRLLPNLMERYLFTISPDHFFFLVCFSKFSIFDFFTIFFSVFVNMGPHWRKNFKRHLFWNYIKDSLQKIMHTSREGLYQSCINYKDWQNFVFVNMGPYGRKSFKRHLVWKCMHNRFPPKNSCILIGRVSTKVV